MSGLANAIDFAVGIFGKVAKDKKGQPLAMTDEHSAQHTAGAKTCLLTTYGMVAVATLWTYDLAHIQWKRGWHGFSFTYFVGTAVQLLGFACLLVKVHDKRSVEGISSQSLVLFAVSLSFRIFTTAVYDGYLPVDWSGDYMCQIMDFVTLLIIFALLHAIHNRFVNTYQEEHDDFHIGAILLACLTSACVVMGGLNKDWYYDAMWAFSLNVEVFQMLPQLYMLAKVGGYVDHATAHWVVNIFLGCVCRFAFWIWAIPGCKELSPNLGYNWEMNMGAFYILGAYTIESLIYLDFVFYYVRARWRGWKSGKFAPVALPAKFDPSQPMDW